MNCLEMRVSILQSIGYDLEEATELAQGKFNFNESLAILQELNDKYNDLNRGNTTQRKANNLILKELHGEIKERDSRYRFNREDYELMLEEFEGDNIDLGLTLRGKPKKGVSKEEIPISFGED